MSTHRVPQVYNLHTELIETHVADLERAVDRAGLRQHFPLLAKVP